MLVDGHVAAAVMHRVAKLENEEAVCKVEKIGLLFLFFLTFSLLDER